MGGHVVCADRARADHLHYPLAFLSLIVGSNLVSRKLTHDARWRPIHRLASALALLMIPLFVSGGLAAAKETGAGIAQRTLLVIVVTWFVVIALRLRANATTPAAPGA